MSFLSLGLSSRTILNCIFGFIIKILQNVLVTSCHSVSDVFATCPTDAPLPPERQNYDYEVSVLIAYLKS